MLLQRLHTCWIRGELSLLRHAASRRRCCRDLAVWMPEAAARLLMLCGTAVSVCCCVFLQVQPWMAAQGGCQGPVWEGQTGSTGACALLLKFVGSPRVCSAPAAMPGLAACIPRPSCLAAAASAKLVCLSHAMSPPPGGPPAPPRSCCWLPVGGVLSWTPRWRCSRALQPLPGSPWTLYNRNWRQRICTWDMWDTLLMTPQTTSQQTGTERMRHGLCAVATAASCRRGSAAGNAAPPCPALPPEPLQLTLSPSCSTLPSTLPPLCAVTRSSQKCWTGQHSRAPLA
jgi:hypothetical protein